jgi:predicted lipid-binding transport protein (Tim44 family)
LPVVRHRGRTGRQVLRQLRHGYFSARHGYVLMTVFGSAGAILARAGGGHSFSRGGGGGSSGGFGGGGGGGGFFFGGGGGGGGGIGIIVLVLIIILAVIIFIAFRRMRTTGNAVDAATQGYGAGGTSGSSSSSSSSSVSSSSTPWTGSQAPAISTVRSDVFGNVLSGTADDAHQGVMPLQEGLNEIKSHDPAFNEEVFLEQVQRAFFVVQEAWTERKPEVSRQVMADGIWQQHRVQIQQYINGHKRNVLEDLAVGDLSVLSAHSDQTYDTVTVRVLAACADYDVDDEKGKVIRGNKSVGEWQEDWTFQRSSDATTKPSGGTLSSKCPNCGAPLDVDLQGVCKFCHAPVMSGKYDWVLARIAQV